MAKRQSIGFDDARDAGGDKPKRVSDIITVYKIPEKKWTTVRFHPEIHCYATAWVRTKTKEGKPTKFPALLRSFDPITQEFDSTVKDPWYEFSQKERADEVDQKDRLVQISKKFYGNMIVRKLQSQKPERTPKPEAEEIESGYKHKDSDTWTDWSAFALPPGLIRSIKELRELNVVESKSGSSTAYSVTDIKYGCDIKIYFDPDQSPANQYKIQLGEQTPLTEEELASLRWDTSDLENEAPSEQKAMKDFADWQRKMGLAKGGDEDEDDTPRRTGRRTFDEGDEDDAPRRTSRRTTEDEGDSDGDARRPRRSFDEDEKEAEKPSRRVAADAENEDAPAPRRRQVEDESGDEPAPRRRQAADSEGEDEPAPRRARQADSEDEDAPAPRRSNRTFAEEDEAPAPRRNRRAVAGDEDSVE
jgi:hypothetical protein